MIAISSRRIPFLGCIYDNTRSVCQNYLNSYFADSIFSVHTGTKFCIIPAWLLSGTADSNRVPEYPLLKMTLFNERIAMKILLWLILLVLCWPLAILALFLYPIIWLLLIPFRLLGITVTAILDFIKAVITLPARLLKRI